MTNYNAALENYNYYGDPRVKVVSSSIKIKVDERRMKAKVIIFDEEEYEISCQYEVCHMCRGKGTVVNPSIDCGGISSDEFYEDPSFREDYFSGVYDIKCPDCNGKRVVPELNPVGEKEDKAYERYLKVVRDDAEYEATVRAERRMGA